MKSIIIGIRKYIFYSDACILDYIRIYFTTACKIMVYPCLADSSTNHDFSDSYQRIFVMATNYLP